MSKIIDNIAYIKEIVDRTNPSCEIVPATKTRSIEEIREAFSSGLIPAVGENKVQELRDKFLPDIPWDFIGRLQTNKVKYLVGNVRLIQSVDRVTLAEEIERLSEKKGLVSDVLVEINTGKEESKGGIYIEDTERMLDIMRGYPHIRVRGLMAVAERGLDAGELMATFDSVRKVFERFRTAEFSYLSMGMSDDYEIALESGSNLIRPGRVIFGERYYGTTGGNHD